MGRIVGVHDVKAAPYKNVSANSKTSCREVEVFYNITQKDFSLTKSRLVRLSLADEVFLKSSNVGHGKLQYRSRSRVLVDPGPKRDDCDLVTCVSE